MRRVTLELSRNVAVDMADKFKTKLCELGDQDMEVVLKHTEVFGLQQEKICAFKKVHCTSLAMYLLCSRVHYMSIHDADIFKRHATLKYNVNIIYHNVYNSMLKSILEMNCKVMALLGLMSMPPGIPGTGPAPGAYKQQQVERI